MARSAFLSLVFLIPLLNSPTLFGQSLSGASSAQQLPPTGETQRTDPHASASNQNQESVEGSSQIVVTVLVFLTGLYIIQGLFAYNKAVRHTINGTTLRDTAFGEAPGLIQTWLATICILIIPFCLSWFPTLPQLHKHQTIRVLRPNDVTAYAGCVSLITVLITVELTMLFDLRGEGSKWQRMLVGAMGLDVVSLFLFTGYIEHPSQWVTETGWWTWIFMTITAFAAFGSSFLIVLFAKTANEYATE